MPSKDTFHEENPETNLWAASDPSLPTFSTPPESSLASARESAASRTRAKNAAHVQALAARLGVDAEELAEKIPEDTLRRLKYPMLQQPDGEGRTKFKHDIGIVNERKPLLGIDRAHEAIEKGSGGKGAQATPRRTDGRFSK